MSLDSNQDFLELETALRGITLGGLRFYPELGSTNDEALSWGTDHAPDFSLVLAEKQTAGRGRDGRKWFSAEGSSLTFSLVLRPNSEERPLLGRFAGLGALALVRALRSWNVEARIKWPNDVLIGGRKAAGILIESSWEGEQLHCLALGMGINVREGSVPPDAQALFPATCLERAAGLKLSRFELLHAVLNQVQELRPVLTHEAFLQAWQSALAYRGEMVRIWQGQQVSFEAEVLGLAADGALRVRKPGCAEEDIHFGEVHLRPLG